MTEWREVREHPGFRASDDGEVMGKRGRVLRGWLSEKGYLRVGVGRTRAVHQLVALAFLGPRPEGMQVRHLNGDKSDNRAANLAYGTGSENIRDKREHGTDHNVNKTHCKFGHEFTPENIYVPPGKPSQRMCRQCRRDRGQHRRRQQRLGKG